MNGLSHRERVRIALNHQEPDRVPIDLGSAASSSICVSVYHKLRTHLGLPPNEPFTITRESDVAILPEDLVRLLDVDLRGIYYRRPRADRTKDLGDGRIVNEWGITLFRPQGGLYYDLVDSPLKEATVEDLDKFDWPDPLDPGRFDGVEEEAEYLYRYTDYALSGPGFGIRLFEDAWQLRGFENFLMDLIVNPDFAHALLRRVLDIRKAMLGRYLELVGKYLDLVYICDDVAMQSGPYMSPRTYRQLIKPYHTELFHCVRERTAARISYHCCGDVVPLLDDFIEMGVDIINPVQVSAKDMDTKVLKERFGDRVCFSGAIDTQGVLPFGTVQDVRDEVGRRLRDLAPRGGYIVAAVHTIQPDVPVENVVAMFGAAKELGTYPINV
jgi:uroporphyrinogen decarboxylase